MTDEIPQAAYALVDKLVIHGANPNEPLMTRYRTFAARLAHENGLVPKEVEPDVPLLAMGAAVQVYHDTLNETDTPTAEMLDAFTSTLAKHGYAVVKVATDEERLIEARELCAMFAKKLYSPTRASQYASGERDNCSEMIAMLVALGWRDGVV